MENPTKPPRVMINTNEVIASVISSRQGQASRMQQGQVSDAIEQQQQQSVTGYHRSMINNQGFSKCTILLGVLVVVFFMLSVALIIAWAIVSDGFKNLGGLANTCNSRACVSAAYHIAKSVDEDVQPCQNFHGYACGRRLFYQPDGDSQQEMLNRAVDSELNAILSRSDEELTTRSGELSRSLFAACLNWPARISNSHLPLLKLLRNLPCGPLFKECNDFNPEFYVWERHVGMVDSYAGNVNLIVYGLTVQPDQGMGKRRRRLVLKLSPPDLSQYLAPIRAELIRFARPEMTTEFDQLMVISIQQRLLNELVQDVLLVNPIERRAMIEEVAELMLILDKTVNGPSKKIQLTFAQLFDTYPQIKWTAMFNAELSTLISFNSSDLLVIDNVDYFFQLSLIVQRSNRRSLANYLTMATILNLRPFIVNNLSRINWRDCVDQMKKLTPVAKMYAQFFVPQNMLEQVTEFVDDLRWSFSADHLNLSVPSSSLITGIEQLTIHIGYPKRLLDEDVVYAPFNDDSSGSIIIDHNDYFNGIVQILRAQRRSDLRRLGSLLDSDDSANYPWLTAAAIYIEEENSIILPMALLQPPLWLPAQSTPMYAVFATLGITFARLLAQVFLQNSPERLRIDAVDCLLQKLNNLNGNSGDSRVSSQMRDRLEMALYLSDATNTVSSAYNKWREHYRIPSESTLPAFPNLTSMQLFFLSFSTLYCDDTDFGNSNGELMNLLAKDSPSFSRAFICTSNDRLYDTQSCTIG